MTKPDSLLIPLTDIATELGVSTDTLEQWSAEQRFPAIYRLGRKLFVERAAFTGYLRENSLDAHRRRAEVREAMVRGAQK